jgi:hypothetical protein
VKVGDIVRVVLNDMSLVIKKPGPKDSKFFNKLGTIIKCNKYRLFNWYDVLFSVGIYEAREDAIEVVSD